MLESGQKTSSLPTPLVTDLGSPGLELGRFVPDRSSRLLIAFQPRQFGWDAQLSDQSWVGRTPRDVAAGIMEFIDAGQPVEVSIYHPLHDGTKLGSGHALVAYDYEQDVSKPTIVRIKVYDCNYAGDDGRFIEFDTKANRWRYRIFSDPGKIHWWSGSTDGMSYESDMNGKNGQWAKYSSDVMADFVKDNTPLIGVLPLSAVMSPGTPPWDPEMPARVSRFASHEDVTPCGVIVTGASRVSRIAAQEAGSLRWAGPMGVTLDSGITAPTTAFYVGTGISAMDVSLVASGSLPTTVALYAHGVVATVGGFAASAGTITASPEGDVAVRSSSETTYGYSASRETTTTSHRVEFSGVGISAEGSHAVDASGSLERVSIRNDGAPTAYDVKVLSLGASSSTWELNRVALNAGDTQTTVIPDWSDPRRGAPYMLVDEGSDGSNDATVALIQTSGAGSSGSALPWIAFFGLVAGGWGTAVVLFSRRGAKPASPATPDPGSGGWAAFDPLAAPISEQAASAIAAPPVQRASHLDIAGRDPVDITKTIVTFGRGPGIDITFDDPRVSRNHAAITLDDSGASISDSGSASGTFLNGVRVQTARLKDGDLIRVGRTEFTFRS